jgi:hypothetical protein
MPLSKSCKNVHKFPGLILPNYGSSRFLQLNAKKLNADAQILQQIINRVFGAGVV